MCKPLQPRRIGRATSCPPAARPKLDAELLPLVEDRVEAQQAGEGARDELDVRVESPIIWIALIPASATKTAISEPSTVE